MSSWSKALVAAACLALAGCASVHEGVFAPEFGPVTAVNQSLRDLPAPDEKIVVAVYDFTDQTGQYKPSENVQTLSRAVTQGADAILVKALQDAGERSWFTVVERNGLTNLLKERQIIKEMRKTYLGEEQVNPNVLPPLLYAGVLLEGGVIGFDTNTVTGGAGARYLGIGGSTKYREDTVTVYLRAVSTRTGEVLAHVTSRKTISSYGISADVFKFVTFDELLEIEAGVTMNEPDQLAVQQAIEKAVYALIVEGADLGAWSFADGGAGETLIRAYRNEAFPRPAGAGEVDEVASADDAATGDVAIAAAMDVDPEAAMIEPAPDEVAAVEPAAPEAKAANAAPTTSEGRRKDAGKDVVVEHDGLVAAVDEDGKPIAYFADAYLD